ncbi:MAG: hypothetical protein J0L92_08070 [Deltaproteobacteria bacterium]|nr:hypothetical protein [Deltaproteobacteria bacterium]
MARINARLDASLARKLDDIRRRTGQTTTAVLVTAIEQYHQRLDQDGRSRAQELFAETGFVGCAAGPRDLAAEYKSYLDFSKDHVREAMPTHGPEDASERQAARPASSRGRRPRASR